MVMTITRDYSPGLCFRRIEPFEDDRLFKYAAGMARYVSNSPSPWSRSVIINLAHFALLTWAQFWCWFPHESYCAPRAPIPSTQLVLDANGVSAFRLRLSVYRVVRGVEPSHIFTKTTSSIVISRFATLSSRPMTNV